MTYTPGPWTWEDWPGGRTLCAGGARIFGCLADRYRDWPGQANADLIAAAPDLLAACNAIVEALGAMCHEREEPGVRQPLDVLAELQTAIAKAEGRAT